MYEVGHFANSGLRYVAGIGGSYYAGGQYSSGLHTYEMGNTYVKKDGVKIISISYSYFEITTPLRIFKINSAGGKVSGKDIRIYNVQVFNTSNDILLDLIPVRVGQTGYMYDKVSGQLFGNSGTGNFILGPDI